MGASPQSGAVRVPAAGLVARLGLQPGRVRWLTWIAAAAGLLGLVASFAALVPVHPLVGYGIAFAAVAAQTLCASWAARGPSRGGLRWLLFPAAAICGVYVSGISGVGAAMVVTVGLLTIGTLLGASIGAGIGHPGHLLFVALVSSGMDGLSVLHPRGLSAALVKSEAALSVLAMSWPLVGTDAIAPILGVGDVVFTALYLAAARAHDLPIRRTLWALGLGYVATFALVVVVQLPVPALPLLGAAVVMAHPRARRPRLADRRVGWVGVGLVASLGVALFLAR